MKTFTVRFNRVAYETGTAEIEAETKESAEAIANEMNAGDIDEWYPVDGDLSVESVEEKS